MPTSYLELDLIHYVVLVYLSETRQAIEECGCIHHSAVVALAGESSRDCLVLLLL